MRNARRIDVRIDVRVDACGSASNYPLHAYCE